MDYPIAHTADGRPLFDNTPTVVCLLVPDEAFRKLLVIRRANEPGKGLLGLPGGYHMRGESWQQAGAREVQEETGFKVDPQVIGVKSLVTDEYGNNLVIGYANPPEELDDRWEEQGEVLEILWLSDAGNPTDWAFPLHYEAAAKYFDQRNGKIGWERLVPQRWRNPTSLI